MADNAHHHGDHGMAGVNGVDPNSQNLYGMHSLAAAAQHAIPREALQAAVGHMVAMPNQWGGYVQQGGVQADPNTMYATQQYVQAMYAQQQDPTQWAPQQQPQPQFHQNYAPAGPTYSPMVSPYAVQGGGGGGGGAGQQHIQRQMNMTGQAGPLSPHHISGGSPMMQQATMQALASPVHQAQMIQNRSRAGSIHQSPLSPIAQMGFSQIQTPPPSATSFHPQMMQQAQQQAQHQQQQLQQQLQQQQQQLQQFAQQSQPQPQQRQPLTPRGSFQLQMPPMPSKQQEIVQPPPQPQPQPQPQSQAQPQPQQISRVPSEPLDNPNDSAESSPLSNPPASPPFTEMAPAPLPPSSPTKLTIPSKTLKPDVRKMVPKPTLKRPRVARIRTEYVAKSSIPQDIPLKEYAEQCKQAAISSRLQPDTLHPHEYQLLKKHLSSIHVTTYLNIRNGILRLWHRNPLVSVTREEAAGCAKDPRFFDLADVAYDWLCRNGYVNFGCIEAPLTGVESNKRRKQRTVIVIGAGMSGLGCARQLEGLFNQLAENLLPDELVPKVIVVEARGRLGGRIYSHPVHNKQLSTLEKGRRATADLGAQIITGFENGNPISTLVQGQLGLPYHALKDGTKLHDIDGKRVDGNRDQLVQRLFNDILDKVYTFIQRGPTAKTVEGDKNLIDQGDDPTGDGDGNGPISTTNDDDDLPSGPTSKLTTPTSSKPPYTTSLDKTAEDKTLMDIDSSSIIPAAEQIRKLGWTLRPGVPDDATIDLQPMSLPGGEYSLGKTMDYVLKEYQKLIELTDQDLRMLNWHYANLEYANAVNVDKLSLRYWDQDDGNEFKGHHSILIGGYQQVPRALYLAPKKLDIRFEHEVTRIDYFGEKVKVEFTNGNVLEGDEVVVTLPLGVLKENKILFEPALPNWKQDAISRLGFGILNKVVLVYKEAFWDVDKDMAGYLNQADGDALSQDSYRKKRGRFYMFWNCIKVSGTPMLVALMAGDAAEDTEKESDETLITEVTAVLSKMFPKENVQKPIESIITRWRSDPYARGSYSYIATGSTGEDYDRMAAPVADKVFFAGEATCGTHPATVHGAYISGLRAASEVATSIFGPIHVSEPLVTPKPKTEPVYAIPPIPASQKRKAEDSASAKYREMKEERLRRYEEELNQAIIDKLGERPLKPGRTGANPFLLYQKDKWFVCKAKCDAETQKKLNNPEAKATRNEVRAALGLMWREAPEDEKRPYLAETEDNKKANGIAATEFKKRLAAWDKEAEKMKEEWKKEKPSVPSAEELALEKEAAEEERSEGKKTKVEGD